MDEMISNELQITPHLLALESFTNTTPASLNSASLASGVVNKFALTTEISSECNNTIIHILRIYSFF